MPTATKRATPKKVAASTTGLATALAALRKKSKKTVRDGMSRFGIHTADEVLGVAVGDIRAIGKAIGRDHALAASLFTCGVYEARLLAMFVEDPALVTTAQMDQWCKGFDNWATCDTACFHLFDRTPHAFGRIEAWSGRKPEFEKRAAFALLASVALHDKRASHEAFLAALPLCEAAARDERNFVKKAVSWALRGVGGRSPELLEASTAMATRLVASGDKTAMWIGKDVLRALRSPAIVARAKKRGRPAATPSG